MGIAEFAFIIPETGKEAVPCLSQGFVKILRENRIRWKEKLIIKSLTVKLTVKEINILVCP